MKAIIYTKYGGPEVLHLAEVAKPIPKDNEVLVKVYAAALNAGDWHTLRGSSFMDRIMGGLFKPRHKILGDDIAGQIESVGKKVTHLKPGDEIFGISCYGGFAEYRCIRVDKYPFQIIGLKPDNLSYEAVAAVPIAAFTALQGLRDKGKIRTGQKVLIIGASGGVGTFAVQIAKSYGTEVTAVCSTKKMEMVRSLGADKVIDYTQEDIMKYGETYDLIFDLAAFSSIFRYTRILNPKGIYVCTGGSGKQYLRSMLLGPLYSLFRSKKFKGHFATPNQKDFKILVNYLKTGKVIPFLDKIFPLTQVPEALTYLESGQAQGKVVISIIQ